MKKEKKKRERKERKEGSEWELFLIEKDLRMVILVFKTLYIMPMYETHVRL